MAILIFFAIFVSLIAIFPILDFFETLSIKRRERKEFKRIDKKHQQFIKSNQYVFDVAIKTFEEVNDDKFELMLNDESVAFGIKTKDEKLVCYNSDSSMYVKFGSYVFHIPHIKEYKNTIKKLQFRINYVSLNRKFNADKETIDKVHKIKDEILKNNL